MEFKDMIKLREGVVAGAVKHKELYPGFLIQYPSIVIGEECWLPWPDSVGSTSSHLVLVGFDSWEEDNHICNCIDFLYRNDNPAMIVGRFHLRHELRGRGLGNLLLDSLYSIAENIGARKRIFLTSVTNPEFWRKQGFEPFPNNSNYWR